MIKDAAELIAELARLGALRIEGPRDDKLFCPQEAWLREFGLWLWKDTPTYKKGQRDCEDFAIRALDRATEALVSAGLIDECGHAICYCEVSIPGWRGNGDPNPGLLNVGGPARHALNIVRCVDEWKFFEPQTGSFTSAEAALRDGLAELVWVWL
jgi:hypothetical protein